MFSFRISFRILDQSSVSFLFQLFCLYGLVIKRKGKKSLASKHNIGASDFS